MHLQPIASHVMRTVLIFICSISVGISLGQNFSYPTIVSTGNILNDFVPVGWVIIDSVSGDLDKNGIADAVIVLQRKDSASVITSEDTVTTKPRILLVLLKGNSDGLFHLKERSNSFILSHDNSIMDDPYQGLAIDKGILKIDFHLFYNMGSWNMTSSTYKFRYGQKAFLLIGADLLTINRTTLDYEEYSFNFLTNKRTYTKGNEEKGLKKVTVKRLTNLKLMTLESYTNPYSWEIEKDVYL